MLCSLLQAVHAAVGWSLNRWKRSEGSERNHLIVQSVAMRQTCMLLALRGMLLLAPLVCVSGRGMGDGRHHVVEKVAGADR
jgi:hypothetical protein